MSWETSADATDVLTADTTDVSSADTTGALSADTTNVLSASTTDVLAATKVQDATKFTWALGPCPRRGEKPIGLKVWQGLASSNFKNCSRNI